MSWKNISLLILLLSQVLAETNDKGRLIYLNKLLRKINNENRIETMLIIQHHTDTKCSLQDWNSLRYPTLRVTEDTKVRIRGHFNDYTVALACISQCSHVQLLDTIADAYQNMREERIILWLQTPLKPKILAKIIDKVNKLKFSQMLILETADNDDELLKFHRLKQFPTAEFIPIKNALSMEGNFFHEEKLNMHGATFNVQASDNFALYLPKKGQEYFPKVRVEDREIIEFADKFNMSLKLFTNNQTTRENIDISLDTYFITKNTSAAQLGFSNPLGTASMIVIVPCSKERSLREIFQYMDIRTWFTYIIYTYIILIIVESLIQITNRRIHGRTLGLTWMMIVNLRAFRSLLGMSFPIRRRTSLSLRQLFLIMSICGMVFSSFFSCKLSSLMTKHSQKAQVTNMEELRASGLTVLANSQIRELIEKEFDPDYFHKTIPNIEFRPDMERHTLLLSLNTTYAQIIFKDNWPIFNKYQLSLGQKAFCTSRDLGVFDNLPKVHFTLENSVLRYFISKFTYWLQEVGITQKWKNEAMYLTVKAMNLTVPPIIQPGAVPLSVKHLKWAGCLLILGHGIAAVVFFIEVLLHRQQRETQRNPTHNHDNVF
ncbi:hypothetical protein KR026_006636 [Drosophila bipectinata]|nr:hypothetical protein KR026_006636 [Drosophila bipectinata]